MEKALGDVDLVRSPGYGGRPLSCSGLGIADCDLRSRDLQKQRAEVKRSAPTLTFVEINMGAGQLHRPTPRLV